MSQLELNERYYLESHWDSWIGPRVATANPDSQQIMAEVERIFQEANKVRECVDRHRRALTGRPATWQFSIDGEEQDLEDADALLRRQLGWMLPRSASRRTTPSGSQVHFPHAIAEAVHNRLLGGTGYLRLWQPQRFQSAPEYRRVALHSPAPGAIEFEDDADGFPVRCKYRYSSEGQSLTEVQELQDNGQTKFWTATSGGEVLPGSESMLDLGGRFTVVSLQGNPIVTPAIRRLQDGLNFILTMIPRNLLFGGFLRDVVINGLPPGEFDAQGSFLPDPAGWQEGPGLKLEVKGLPLFDNEGNVSGYTTPSLETREPVDVSPFLEAAKAQISILYEQFGQGFVLGADLSISGVSRVQQRADFALAAAEDAAALSAALSGLYTAAYLMIAPTKGDLDVLVDVPLAIAEPTAEEQAQTRENYNAKLMDIATAMARIGIKNPEEEILRIENREAAAASARSPTNDELLNPSDLPDPNKEDDENA